MSRRGDWISDEGIAALIADNTVQRPAEPAPDWLAVFIAGQMSTPTAPRRTWSERINLAASVVLLTICLAVLVGTAAWLIHASVTAR